MVFMVQSHKVGHNKETPAQIKLKTHITIQILTLNTPFQALNAVDLEEFGAMEP